MSTLLFFFSFVLFISFPHLAVLDDLVDGLGDRGLHVSDGDGHCLAFERGRGMGTKRERGKKRKSGKSSFSPLSFGSLVSLLKSRLGMLMSPSSPSASLASEDDSSPRKRRAPSARVAAAAASAAAAFGGAGAGGGAAGQATSPSPNRRMPLPASLPPPPPPLDGIRQFATFSSATEATPQFARELGEALSRATWASEGGEPADVAAVVPAATAVSILEALAERLAADATVIDVSL